MLGEAGEKAEPLPKFEPDALGDCIDCTMCVQVCPTGIDIRNGLQIECIACGLCVDACNNVMDLMGYSRGLIRYSTQNAIDGKPSRVLRPRIMVYGALLLVLVSGFAWGIANRSPLIADVLRDRNALYRETADGAVENDYTLKLVNKTDRDRSFRIRIEAANPAIALREDTASVDARAEAVVSVPVVLVARDGASGRNDVRFIIESDDGTSRETVDSSFFGPM